MFSYSLPDGRSGLRVAWRADSLDSWKHIGQNYNLVNSDFGPWGSHKTMFSPRLLKDSNSGLWTCIWKADANGDVTAMTTSEDLIRWSPQRYFANEADLPHYIHAATAATPDSTIIGNLTVKGFRQTVNRSVLDRLINSVDHRTHMAALYDEQAKDDDTRFAGLGTVRLTATARPDAAKKISDKLIGIFFEDINYGADGGLYAELIQNRDFEYRPDEKRNHPEWNATKAWSLNTGDDITIATANPVHPNNPHYAVLQAGDQPLTLANEGFGGISVKHNGQYRLSIMARSNKPTRLSVKLTTPEGKKLSDTTIKIQGPEWNTYTARLKPNANAIKARLEITIAAGDSADVDMVSLFPADTFHGRNNGLRADLAQTLADLHPKFVRFPGGCVAHGDGIDNIYDWKGSIGPLEARKPLRNLWGYHQTRGLGYHEYFLFCEDIGAEPVPVLAAGVPCQNSGTASHHSHHPVTALGQQCGIPMDEMDDYIRDVLDLIEYANGPVTSTWGARRAEAGHPEPFNLKYIGIGNEDMITEVFVPRFRMIYEAVRAAHPEVKVIGTVGPFYEGTDYDTGWQLARELNVPLVDEHYYVQPGWMIHNGDFYDRYPRGGTHVYLGEYAAHLPGRPNNVETALAEALYLTGIERNGDVVEMTSYAPLLAKKGHTQWKPDLIYFTNDSVRLTPDYHVQKLYGRNSGTRYIPVDIDVVPADSATVCRIGMSVVSDPDTDEYIIKLVNMLPLQVNAHIDLSPLGIDSHTGTATILTGAPDDRTATPADTDITLPDAVLPPYSFTVARIPHHNTPRP